MTKKDNLYEPIILQKSGVAVTFDKKNVAPANDLGKPSKKQPINTAKPWVEYASGNTPQELMKAVLDNSILPGIIDTKVDFIIGGGIMLLKKVIDNGKRKTVEVEAPEITDVLDAINFDEVIIKACTDEQNTGNGYIEVILTNDKSRIVAFNHRDTCSVKSGEINPATGVPDNYYICSDWSSAIYDPKAKDLKGSNVATVPGYNPTDPKKYSHFIIHLKRYVTGYPYYSPPSWIGAKNFVALANRIPTFHAAAIENGYNIRYHVSIPQAYFDQFDQKDRKKKKEELKADMDEMLSGADNAGKAIITFATRVDGGNIDKWTIDPIETKLNDDAYASHYEMGQSSVISANSMPPSLAGIQIAGSLSSGSEQRLAVEFYQKIKTPRPRKVMLKAFYILQTILGWDKSIKAGFSDITFETLSANPTGSSVSVASATPPPNAIQ